MKSLNRLSGRRVRSSRSFFIQSDLVEAFIEKTSQDLQDCVLFTGHSDRNFDHSPKFPENVRFWFGQNSTVSDSRRYFTLPIGLENLSLGRAGRKSFFRCSCQIEKVRNRILVPPMSATNPIRLFASLYCRNNNLFDVRTELIPEKQYFELTCRYRFVLCLEGNGYDNHRLWETLYQGNFPVVIRTKWSQSLSYLNLPILYLDKLSDVSPDLLLRFSRLNSNFSPNDLEMLWSPFWKRIATLDSQAIDELGIDLGNQRRIGLY
jgi:hypothetical protein